MKKIMKYFPKEEIIQQDKDCRNWLSEMTSWRYGVRFMEVMLPRVIAPDKSTNDLKKLRTFRQKLNESVGARMNELYKKIRQYQIDIRKQLQTKNTRKLSGNRILHGFFKKEVLQIKTQYKNMRQSFFDLMKPSLQGKKMQNAA